MSDRGFPQWRSVLATLGALGMITGGLVTTMKAADTPGKEVTFSKDVAPIAYENCVYCHRPGEVAPFSMLTYKDARPWARSIRQRVMNGQMPPWKADPHYGQFQNTKILTKQQIDTIAWVDGVVKEGDPAAMRPAPQFAEGWQIVTPDLVLTMKAPFTVPASGAVPWMVIPSNDYVFPKDTWIQAIEVRPGNRKVVHHAVAQANYPGENPNLGGGSLHLYSPGLEAIVWRDGYGKLIPKGTRISFQMHYNAIGKETTDQTKVGFKFATKPVHTQVNTTTFNNLAIVIPPMVQNHEAITGFQFPTESRIHAFRPHMHLRGRYATDSLIMPDGLRSVLLHLPHWDDAWQNYYILSSRFASEGRLSSTSRLRQLARQSAQPRSEGDRLVGTTGWKKCSRLHDLDGDQRQERQRHRADSDSANKAFTTGVVAAGTEEMSMMSNGCSSPRCFWPS